MDQGSRYGPPVERKQNGSLYEMTPVQQRQAARVIQKFCCNCEKGNCILLEDGDERVCPQRISYSVGCRWFRNAVLPAFPELEAKKKELQCYRTLCDYLHHLQQWKTDYAPEHPYEEYHPLFVKALQNSSYVEYILDDVFLNGGAEDKAVFIREHGDDVLALDKRLQGFATEKEKMPQQSLVI